MSKCVLLGCFIYGRRVFHLQSPPSCCPPRTYIKHKRHHGTQSKVSAVYAALFMERPAQYDLIHASCTAHMDQMVVWLHILSFRPTGSNRSAHMSAVSPEVRRVHEARKQHQIAMCEMPHLIWWLRIQPKDVELLAARDRFTADALMTALMQPHPFPQLRTIHLWSCTLITDDVLGHIHWCTHLQTLKLPDCDRITDAGLAHLKSLAQLETLDISCCALITDVGLSNLEGLKRLHTLDLSYCMLVTDVGLAHLVALTQLRKLFLRCCKLITDMGLAHLKGVAQLQTLSIASCSLITDAGLGHVGSLAHVEDLDCSRCHLITNAGLAHLKGLTQLKTLRTSYCARITDVGLAYFRRLGKAR